MNRRGLVPTAAAAIALGVTAAAVRKMAARGQLTRYGTPQRALYDVVELISVRKGLGGRVDGAAYAPLACRS